MIWGGMEILCPHGVVKKAEDLVPGDKVLYRRTPASKPQETTVIRVEKGGLQEMRQYLIRRDNGYVLHWVTCTKDSLVWKKDYGYVTAVSMRIGDLIAVYEAGFRCYGRVIEKSKTLVQGIGRKIITESGQFIAELVEMGEAY